jgi:tyrosine-protein phosphatase YwqE
MFDFFKKKSKEEVVVDLGELAVDLHSHLIPGIDDGAKTLEESIKLISELKDLGYQKLITTPHIMSDYYRNKPETILAGLDAVRNELSKQNIDIIIEAAAEYYYDEYFVDMLKKKEIMTIGSDYVLFEFSYLSAPTAAAELIFDIQTRGWKPLLAHPERYPYFKMQQLMALKEAGCLFQMNLLSLTGHYGTATQKIAEDLLEYNMVEFLATDLHHMQHIRLIKQNVLHNQKVLDLINFGSLRNRELL